MITIRKRKSEMCRLLSILFEIFDIAPLFTSSLLHDITQLFNDADDYNVSIVVGGGNDKETFKAHSVLLRVRSPCFKNDIPKKENNMIVFTKTNIFPKVFEKILK